MARHHHHGPKPSGFIFPWRGLNAPLMPKVLAAVLLFGVFAFAITFVRVDISARPHWLEEKASIIDLRMGKDAELWARRAQEEGPFPSRVDPDSWNVMKQLENQVSDAFRTPSMPYVPQLRDLPQGEPVSGIPFTAKGERVFPKHQAPEWVQQPDAARLVPQLYPLVEVPMDAMPKKLPAFAGEIAPEMTYTPWRFLIRLTPDGVVSDCVSLVGTSEAGAGSLEKWLRQVKFDPGFAEKHEWIALAVTFVNQPADGTDTH
ncbi:hypothetical protein JIN85_12260 [Luteolibacter pohnpeiensis]|uniref:Uncharacterized protein n=1 Tax=Luteolibacter pohnpeiensis TaxID=454153 RepID=A0A934VWV3_9BACT|nr:hypothetical protein [Luteolibacter pohnpeiensis]MBK1883193.1 hypothetical protein [Luteolibacter pohnpeiensis]